MSAGFLFFIKHKTVETENSIARLNYKRQSYAQKLRLLHNEWSVLSSPARVEALVKKILPYAQPLQREQMRTIGELETHYHRAGS